MKLSIIAAAALAAISLSGCATLIEGTDQQIVVRPDQASTSCAGTRQDRPIFITFPGHDVVTVSKSRNAIDLTCNAPGFSTGHQTIESSVTAWGVTSMAAVDFGITDYATGALNKYPDAVDVKLVPLAPKP